MRGRVKFWPKTACPRAEPCIGFPTTSTTTQTDRKKEKGGGETKLALPPCLRFSLTASHSLHRKLRSEAQTEDNCTQTALGGVVALYLPPHLNITSIKYRLSAVCRTVRVSQACGYILINFQGVQSRDVVQWWSLTDQALSLLPCITEKQCQLLKHCV